MRMFEIATKYFILNQTAAIILEAYANPSQELEIKFDLIVEEYGKKFYKAVVSEISTAKPLVLIYFSLSESDTGIDIGNVEPLADSGKTVHTSLGTQNNGVELGTKAVIWLQRQIKSFALSQGFDVKSINTNTRYTGARAANNPGLDPSGDLKSFSTKVGLKESRTELPAPLIQRQ